MYTLLKLNITTKQWIKTKNHYDTFPDAISDISFESVQHILLNKQTYTKEKFSFPETHKWTGILLKKNLNKVYITKWNNVYKLIEED